VSPFWSRGKLLNTLVSLFTAQIGVWYASREAVWAREWVSFMAKTVFAKEFPSTTQDLAETLTAALNALIAHRWCTLEDSFCIRLCLEEALVNAVVHGNKNQPSRMVHVEIVEDGDRCRICVRDEGNGFDPTGISMPDCNQLGGRGVCLIKHYMDEVHFDYDRNCLSMEFSRDTFSCEV
jgi:serine/threonine-protein kinase RsbW